MMSRVAARDGSRVCIIGTGYVGIASAIGLAELGHDVVGYDILPERVEALRNGISPYKESGLEDRLRRHVASGVLRFETELEPALEGATAILLAVGTPARDDGSCDLRFLSLAIDRLARVRLAPGAIVAIRSTVPVGTSDGIAKRLAGIAETVYAPEFLREGSAVDDFLAPDRIIVGSASRDAAIAYAQMFESIGAPLVLTSRRNAELVKISSNAFLALKISFANEIANLCGACGADSDEVLRGVGYDRRIGGAFLAPGIGFGGPCFEKDVRSLERSAREFGAPSALATATLLVNALQPESFVDIVRDELGDLFGTRIAIWGLAFKAGTDDTRDSLALRVVTMLASAGAILIAFDPAVSNCELPPGATFAASAEAALVDADALVVLTEWPFFKTVPPSAIAIRLRLKVVVDGRNVLDRDRLVAAGLRYRGIGLRAMPSLPAFA